ncbi:MAG: helix-turn-helix transcriptional regulator [Bacteroidetes bacterium]|nr:helix-turn-helix transcriptional regulator [Bacteroidota bacterium]
MDIGTKIKKIRELKNVTQEHIAEALKMSTRGYSKIENNESNINLDKLEKISKVLEVKLTDLLNFNEKQVFNNNFKNLEGNLGDNFVMYKFSDFKKEKELYDLLLSSKEDQIKILKNELENLRKK